MKTIHKLYTGLCQHKTFYGMLNGHCVKCGKPFKNCEKCYPSSKNNITMTPLRTAIEEILVTPTKQITSYRKLTETIQYRDLTVKRLLELFEKTMDEVLGLDENIRDKDGYIRSYYMDRNHLRKEQRERLHSVIGKGKVYGSIQK